MTHRIGQGFDIHRLEPGRRCVIGGVEIPHDSGPVGHSDGDPLLHAVIDALLGAAGMGDIGELYPDTDPRWKDADSRELLREVSARVIAGGWQVVNLDVTVLAEAPKLKEYKREMEDVIARLLDISSDRINVKAKTMEGLGAVGRAEAIGAQAVVLMEAR